MGEALATRVNRVFSGNHDIDVVIPVLYIKVFLYFWFTKYMEAYIVNIICLTIVKHNAHCIKVPDTSRVAALQLATHLKVVYREGFVKNRYVGRTFIMPGQTERRKNVRRKLNPMPMEFADKNVLIVDGTVHRLQQCQALSINFFALY